MIYLFDVHHDPASYIYIFIYTAFYSLIGLIYIIYIYVEPYIYNIYNS